jgi:hypothetical protein
MQLLPCHWAERLGDQPGQLYEILATVRPLGPGRSWDGLVVLQGAQLGPWAAGFGGGRPRPAPELAPLPLLRTGGKRHGLDKCEFTPMDRQGSRAVVFVSKIKLEGLWSMRLKPLPQRHAARPPPPPRSGAEGARGEGGGGGRGAGRRVPRPWCRACTFYWLLSVPSPRSLRLLGVGQEGGILGRFVP